jgi:hypothetical protein
MWLHNARFKLHFYAVIARSESDEAIQGRLAPGAGLLRHSPSKTGVNALMARNDKGHIWRPARNDSSIMPIISTANISF